MKKIIIAISALLLITTACKKDEEEEFVSYILAVEKQNFGQNNLDIEAVVIGSKIRIDSFFVHVIHEDPPVNENVYRFGGTLESGKQNFHINNLTPGTNYRYYIIASTWDGRNSRIIRTNDLTGTTTP